jgi:hypothetical protein
MPGGTALFIVENDEGNVEAALVAGELARHPYATFVLTQQLPLSSAFSSGATISLPLVGRLSMNGVSRRVTFATSERRNGRALQVAGSIPVSLGTWGVKRPAGLGPLGSLANHGVAEFVLEE